MSRKFRLFIICENFICGCLYSRLHCQQLTLRVEGVTIPSVCVLRQVMVKCRSLSTNSSARADAEAATLNLGGVSEGIPLRSTEVLSKFRDEVKGLIKYLDDSKGMFNRMADTLCQESVEYEQDMQSSRCWNGTAVAR